MKSEGKKETLPNEASMEQLPDANRPPSDYKPAEDEDNIPERNSALDMAPSISEKAILPLEMTMTKTVKVVAEQAFPEEVAHM